MDDYVIWTKPPIKYNYTKLYKRYTRNKEKGIQTQHRRKPSTYKTRDKTITKDEKTIKQLENN